MANSFVRYTGDNSTTSYSIPFSYRATGDLTITLAGSATTAYSLNAAGTTLTFNTAPASGVAIEIRRTTSQTTRLTDYASGSVLTENDLDTDSEQAFFMSQEAIDDAGDVIKLSNIDFQWDTQNKRLKNVADPVDNTDAVNKQFISANLPNITTVSGIASDVTDVANIASDVTLVANDETDIGIVSTNIASVNTVATNIADVIKVADDLNEAISEVETVADDLNEAVSEIDTVANNITDINTVGNSTNINNITLVAGQISPTNNISTLAGLTTEIGQVAAIDSDITDVANINSEVSTVAGLNTEIAGVYAISGQITAVNSNSSNINTVATDLLGSNTIGAVATDLAGSNTIGTVATNIASVTDVSNNIGSVNDFAARYRVSATAPSTSLDVGDLWFDSTNDIMKVYSSGGFINTGSSVNGTSERYTYTVSSSTTTISGNDDSGNSLTYDSPYIDVYLNGVKMVNGTDVTVSSGTSIVFASPIGASGTDVVDVVTFGTFELANFSINDANDVSTAGVTDGQVLTYNASSSTFQPGNASSAEVYGFNKNASGELIVTTTNGGADNIDAATFDAFDDVLFSASGFTFSINANGNLISTI